MKAWWARGALALGISVQAHAQAPASMWPSWPIRIVVTSAAGSAPDLLARTLGAELQKRLGQPVVADNKPGAGGSLGATMSSVMTVSSEGPTEVARFEQTVCCVLLAPAGKSQDVVARRNHEVGDHLRMPQVIARFANTGATTGTDSPAGLRRMAIAKADKWSRVARESGAIAG